MMELAKHGLELLIAVSTFGLWYSTARMNHFEKMKLTQIVQEDTKILSHDNDNLTEVAITAIQHSDRVRKLKRVSRRNHKGEIL